MPSLKSASRSGRASKRGISGSLAGVEVGDHAPVRVMAAINVSPESFYSGSVARGRRALAARVRQATVEGADFLDLGAMSTAPYRAGWIEEAEERRRLVAAVRVARQESPLPISVDTQRASVAEAALEAGAQIINDVSGLAADPRMAAVAKAAAGLIVMAKESRPSREPPLALVCRLLRAALARAKKAGVSLAHVAVDPGIGFFRRAQLPWFEFDIALLRGLSRLRRLERPILVGVSRKSFLGRLTGRTDPEERLAASLAAATVAVLNGAHIVRAHDVAATVDACRVAQALRAPGSMR